MSYTLSFLYPLQIIHPSTHELISMIVFLTYSWQWSDGKVQSLYFIIRTYWPYGQIDRTILVSVYNHLTRETDGNNIDMYVSIICWPILYIGWTVIGCIGECINSWGCGIGHVDYLSGKKRKEKLIRRECKPEVSDERERERMRNIERMMN